MSVCIVCSVCLCVCVRACSSPKYRHYACMRTGVLVCMRVCVVDRSEVLQLTVHYNLLPLLYNFLCI